MINFNLLKIIRERGLRQRDFARMVGRSESEISQVVTGKLNLNEDLQRQYAKVLGVHIQDVFPQAGSKEGGR